MFLNLFFIVLVLFLILILFPFKAKINFVLNGKRLVLVFFFLKFKFSWTFKNPFSENKKLKEETKFKSQPKKYTEEKRTENKKEESKISDKETETSTKKELKNEELNKPSETTSETSVVNSETIPNEEDKKEKQKLTEKDYWIILLQSRNLRRLFFILKKTTKTFFKIFQAKFSKVYLRGISCSEYKNTGILASVFAFCKGTFKTLENWNVSFDWTKREPFLWKGQLVISVTLLRIFIFLFFVLYFALQILMFYLLEKRKYLKDKNNFELPFWKRKIIAFFTAEELCEN